MSCSFDDYLMHYGVTGQKWGVRRWQNPDGTLTPAGKEHYAVSFGGNKALDKKFNREMSKMRKLVVKADTDYQKEQAEKFDARAKKAVKVGNTAAVAALSTNAISDAGHKLLGDKNANLQKQYDRQISDYNFWRDDSNFDGSKSVNITVREGTRKELALHNLFESFSTKSAIARIASHEKVLSSVMPVLGQVALGTAAGSYAVAGYNKARSAVAKNRTTETGHAKAVSKAQAQYDRMKKTFAGTPYSGLLKAQIAAYKKQHPNTELSDRQIMNNLMA